MGLARSCALLDSKLIFKSCQGHYFLLPLLSWTPSGCVLHCQRSSLSLCMKLNYLCVKLVSQWFLVSYELNLTGKPFIHPDGSTVVYNPASIAPAAGRIQQQGKNPQQPIPAAAQQQSTNHLHSQVSGWCFFFPGGISFSFSFPFKLASVLLFFFLTFS